MIQFSYDENIKNQLDEDKKIKIENILNRIQVGTDSYNWKKSKPNEIKIIKELTGGRGLSKVYEVQFKWKEQQFLGAIKIGPRYELKNEIQGFDFIPKELLNAYFIPIMAATPGVLLESESESGEDEAIVYKHAKYWLGNPKTFEKIAQTAVNSGGTDLETAIKILEKLFVGINQNIYQDRELEVNITALRKYWNSRLGPDGVIEVEEYDRDKRLLKVGSPSETDLNDNQILPGHIKATEAWKGGSVKPGDLIYLQCMEVKWRGNRLMGIEESKNLRFEIVDVGNRGIRDIIKTDIRTGESFDVYGKIKSIRAIIHKKRLLGILEGLKIENGLIHATDVTVPDIFAALQDMLETSRRGRITSLVHGDLNPRNILVIENTPCLIDYALTRKGELPLSDFVRLEGCLARDILPTDLSLKQHVRLQRFLAVSCRLDDKTTKEKFTQLLAQDRKELASAFQLFYAIRENSKQVYPESEYHVWYQDYCEQLFLFSHLTLKWEEKEQSPHALRATVAMAGVALEAISKEEIYRWWDLEDLQSDGLEIIKLIKDHVECFKRNPKLWLSEMANFARGIDFWKKKKRDSILPKYEHIKNEYLRDCAINTDLDAELHKSLVSEFEELRSEFVCNTFCNEANSILVNPKKDRQTFINHQAYIDLKGKICVASGQKQSDTIDNAMELVAKESESVLVGDAGSGKSTVAFEWRYLLAGLITGNDNTLNKKHTPRLPIFTESPSLLELLRDSNENDNKYIAKVVSQLLTEMRKNLKLPDNNQSPADVISQSQDLLTVGALYITVDSLNELTEENKRKVVDWVTKLRSMYPRTPVLVCHRQYNFVPGLLPFPVITLQKVSKIQAKEYIFKYLYAKKVSDHHEKVQRLVRLLLEAPEQKHVQDLAQTPLFLWMIVEYYKDKEEIPESRGQLFKQFAKQYIEEQHHKEHTERVLPKYDYADKEILLGAISYELVQLGTIYLSENEVESLVLKKIRNKWREILKEVIDSGMLRSENGKLHFLHQSFQEYFAACHFLEHEATDKDALQKKVWQHGWHDTFVILLGFAGEKQEVVQQIVQIAMEVNPVLTARFLRVAESVDQNILQQFIKTQEAVLRNLQSGSFAYSQAVKALDEYGSEQSLKDMIDLASDLKVPLESRIEVLMHLAKMPEQTRFESKKPLLQNKLEEMMVKVFNQKENPKIYHVCIGIVEALNLGNFNIYLLNFIKDECTTWSLKRLAWDTCKKMGVKMPPEYIRIYRQACMKRLPCSEDELFQTSRLDEMKELNEERCYLLEHIASIENLSQLLMRRFSLIIHGNVEKIVDNVLKGVEQSPGIPNDAWDILNVQNPDNAIIDRWLSLIREGDSLVATAAAHQLVKIQKQVKKFHLQKLKELLDTELTPDRLLMVAELISAYGDRDIAELLERFLHDLIKKTESSKEFEALARIALVLKELDTQRGNYLIAYVIMYFFQDDKGVPGGLYPLLTLYNQLYLSEEDLKTLINKDVNYARAAIFKMQTLGAITLLFAEKKTVTKLDTASVQRILSLAAKENHLKWQCFFAIAAVKSHTSELLPCLVTVVKNTSFWEDGTIKYYHWSYKTIEESWLAMIIRAIGYLARLLRDNNRTEEAKPAVELLHNQYHNLSKNTNRQIVIGLSTALGFLGEWKPILENLKPGEPWIHETARNIFNEWLPLSERIKATNWIIQQLKECNLEADVRSTFMKLKGDFEGEIKHYIPPDKDISQIINMDIIVKMDVIRDLFQNKAIPAFSEKVSELLKGPQKLSKNIYFELNEYLRELIPNFPKPDLKYDIRNFSEIIENIWIFAGNYGLEERFGVIVYRWYEHNGNYPKAREILQNLIDIAEKNNDILKKGMYTNDFAFEYLLEQNWKEAAKKFKEAEELFRGKDEILFYNAKANHWTCKIENNDIDNIEAIEQELKSILEKLRLSNSPWHVRKPYILLAKLEERKGNIEKAIEHVEKALSLTQTSTTLYPEEDRKYLNKLKTRIISL